MNNPIKIKDIKITDSLFGNYVELVLKKIVPYQWDALNDEISDAEKSHCIDNFRTAAGEKRGTHIGAIFQDTDLYKWLEAVAYCIQYGNGDEFIEIADGVIDLISRAQESDGYINTYYTLARPERKWKNLTEGHELYNAGHLIEAAVAYYKATGKDLLLNVARRFADLICDLFGPEKGKCKGYPGHQEIELALVKLYQVTDEKRYLDLANFFIENRGSSHNYIIEEVNNRGGFEFFPEFSEYDDEYAQVHQLPIEQKTAEGHAVRALYMYSAMADLARENNDEKLEAACKTLFENLTTRRMYITGGVGSSGKLERFTVDYDLPNDRMYCESCASIGLMMFGQRMAELTKDARYYDTVERALCNTVLAGISKNGDRYFYVNPLEVWPDNCKASTSMSHVKPVRQKWFSCACCPPNIARTLASLGQYIFAQDNMSLYINQFISSDLSADINGNDVSISMDSTYMENGRICIKIMSSSPELIKLHIRIPDYLESPKITLNDVILQPNIIKGYLVIDITKEGEQILEINSTVKPMFVAANQNVRSNVGNVAIMKGPYVYCLEETDNGKNLPSIYVKSGKSIVEEVSIDELPGRLPTLICEGERITQTIADDEKLYGVPEFKKENTKVKAIPYCLWCNRTPGEMKVWVNAKFN